MKNIVGAAFFALVFGAVPLFAHAQITSLNGLTNTIQQLVSPGPNATNTMHMEIVPVGTDRHRFRWDGTPWRVDQGGTGGLLSIVDDFNVLFEGINAPTASAPGGSIQLSAGSAVGGDGAGGDVLIFAGQESGDGDFGEILLQTLDGDTSIRTEQDVSLFSATGGINLEGFASGINLRSSPTSQFAILKTSFLVDTDKTFELPNFSGTFGLLENNQTWSGENTFTEAVRLEGAGSSEGSCLIMKDSDGDGYTYITANDGVLTASTEPCN